MKDNGDEAIVKVWTSLSSVFKRRWNLIGLHSMFVAFFFSLCVSFPCRSL